MFSVVNGRLHGTRVFTGKCSSEWRASFSWNHVDSFMFSHLSSFYLFFSFQFFVRHEQDANGAFFLEVVMSPLSFWRYAYLRFLIPEALCSCSFVYGVKILSIQVFQVYRLIYNLYIYDFKVKYVDKYLTNMCEIFNLVKSF